MCVLFFYCFGRENIYFFLFIFCIERCFVFIVIFNNIFCKMIILEGRLIMFLIFIMIFVVIFVLFIFIYVVKDLFVCRLEILFGNNVRFVF